MNDLPSFDKPTTHPGPDIAAPAAATGPRRLTRSRDDAMLSGVCGGIAR